MKKGYYGNEATIYSKVVNDTMSFMYRTNASYIKENDLNNDNICNLGNCSKNEFIYTIDTIDNSNKILVKRTNAKCLFTYAEIIKSGVFLLCDLCNLEIEDIHIEINYNEKTFSEKYEDLKLFLLNLDIDFNFKKSDDITEDLIFKYIVNENFDAGKGFLNKDKIFYSIDIDQIIENLETEINNNEIHPDIYVIADSNEEKMHAMKIVDKQRGNLINVIMFTEEITREEQLNIAKKSLADYIIDLNVEDLKKDLVTLISNLYGTKELVDINEIEEHICLDF